jgi:hypothetical protein
MLTPSLEILKPAPSTGSWGHYVFLSRAPVEIWSPSIIVTSGWLRGYFEFDIYLASCNGLHDARST